MFRSTCSHQGTCRDSCSAESFTIPDSAASNVQGKIKEALYIKWEIPNLNQQLRHSVSILFHFLFYFCVRAVLCSQCISNC